MPKDLYPRLCVPDTLRVAVNYVLDDQKDDFIPDVFRHQDYLYNLNANLTRLANSLKNGTYRPRSDEETNRFRKFLWSLGHNAELCKPTLKTIGKIERDPARLLVSLYGALESRD